MTEEEKEKLKAKILSDIEQVSESIILAKDSTQPVVPDVSLGRLTRMEAINSQNISKATLAAMKENLIKLNAALERIDSEDFGYCLSCDEEISLKRLMLMPGNTLCVKCAK